MILSIFHAILCSDITTDSRTGQTSYFKVIDTITTPKLPLGINGPFLGALCQGHTTKPVSLRLDLLAPDNSIININEFSVTFTNTPQKLIVQLGRILFAHSGPHQIILSFQESEAWQAAASMPVLVQMTT